MQKHILPIVILAIIAGCSGKNNLSDAYGNFETNEHLISAEGQGTLMEFKVEEGSILSAGEIVGYIDTSALHLQKQQLIARIRAIESQKPGVKAQINVQESQRNTLLHEKERLENLIRDNAATGKQLDDLNGQLKTVDAQIIATRSSYETIESEILAVKAQLNSVADQLSRNIIINPLDGTVLEKFMETYEMAVPGKSLYKIADMNTMILRVYISGEQLVSVKIGQEAGVIIDDPATLDNPIIGKVTWVSGKAEFTPKIIQTREERVNLVYALKIEVPNDGRLKIGMPAEVVF